MYLINGGNFRELKGQSVQLGREKDVFEEIEEYEIKVNTGDTIYMFSDGFPDQRGGPKRKKFYYPPFRQMFIDMQELKMEDQLNRISEIMDDWKGDNEQMDDMLVIGIRF